MSRAHMLYDDTPLGQTQVGTTTWPGPWEQAGSGAGVLLEGVFCRKGKHVIIDSSKEKHRFVLLHVEFLRAHRRKFNSSGEEIEPNFGLLGKISKGYLPSSYKAEAKGEHDILSLNEVRRIFSGRLSDAVLAPHSGWLVLWGDEGSHDHLNLECGDQLRVKTRGDCPLIESIAVLDTSQRKTTSNFAGGDNVGASWTDKVMGFKSATSAEDKPLAHEQLQGVDDDEWDD